MPDDKPTGKDTQGDGDRSLAGELVGDDDVDDAPDDLGGLEQMLGALAGGDVELDMGSLLGSAMQVQQQMLQAQNQAAATEVEGVAGGGVVKVVMTGGFEFHKVTIAPEVIDADDVEMLEDLVLAAVRDAVSRAVELTESSMPSLGLGMGGGSLDLGDMLGAFAAEDSGDELVQERDPADDHDGEAGGDPDLNEHPDRPR